MALVVIGGNAAGMSAASRARRLDPSLEIVVLEKGPVISYGACGLPYVLEGRVRQAADLVVRTVGYFRKEMKIDVRTGDAAVAISHSRREVTTASGARVRYEHLVLATGARCALTGMEGAGRPHVFTLHSLADAERMRGFFAERRPRSAVVIGAGYLGLEAADALRRNGLRVTVLERSADALRRDDAEFTAAIRKRLADHGVELQCGTDVREIGADRVAGVPADLVVIAAGFQPNVEMAAAAGIEPGRTGALRADEHTETGLNGVYAAGDCAETMHAVTGRPAWIPLGTTANKMGRVAGANAAGKRVRFGGIAGTSIVGVFGAAFAVTGLSAAQARAEGFAPVSARVEAPTRPKYYAPSTTVVELVADRTSGRLLGGSVIGEDGAAGRINTIAAALQARMRAEDFEQLDLAYSPPFAPVWDPLLIAARKLLKEL